MKKTLLCLLALWGCLPSFGKITENKVYFQAMKDEMKRTLTELHLPGEPRPYFVAYRVREKYMAVSQASLGKAYPPWKGDFVLHALSLLKVGNDQNNNTGYYNSNRAWKYVSRASASNSYEGVRQALWEGSNFAYLEAIEQYREKEAYLHQKDVQDKQPDVVASKQGVYLENIPAWKPFHQAEIDRWTEKVSAWGKELPFVEDCLVRVVQRQTNDYYLNSLGGKSQFYIVSYQVDFSMKFRQPDGYEELLNTDLSLKDLSPEQLARAEQKMREFMQQVKGIYNAPAADSYYLGPVLYKPTAAADFMFRLTSVLKNMAPWYNAEEDQDTSASRLRKRIGWPVVSAGIDIYDLPTRKEYNGIHLSLFSRLDWEGIPSQDLQLVKNGQLKQVPLSQRPFLDAKTHQSNGHAFTQSPQGGIREDVSNIFIVPNPWLTEEQLEEQFLALCKEAKLTYCYIKQGDYFQRMYTQDGRKEWVLGLKETDPFLRSLRDIVAAGGKEELVYDWMVVPSLLVREIELEPVDRHPDRKPLVAKPE